MANVRYGEVAREATIAEFIGTIGVTYTAGTGPPPPDSTRHYPSLFEDSLGRLHCVHAKNGIVYRRSDFSTPPFAITTQVTTVAGHIEPVVAVTPDLRAHVLYTTGSNVYYTTSDDDGATWSPPTIMISGGKHPAIAVKRDGTILFGAILRIPILGNSTTFRLQRPGDSVAQDPYPLYPRNLAGTFQTEWADDSFGIAWAGDNQDSLLLHGLVLVSVGGAAESATSVWASYNDGGNFIRAG